MFSNIGTKIKTLAQILCWMGILASAVAGLVLLTTSGQTGTGIAVMLGGPPLSWIASFLFYGLGQLIENTDALVAIQSGNAGKPVALSQADKLNKLQILNVLHSQQLVTGADVLKAKEEWDV
mgnify:CR=1 FL=1